MKAIGIAAIVGLLTLMWVVPIVGANHSNVTSPLAVVGLGPACPAGTSTTVTVQNFFFSPTPTTISLGDTVVFSNIAGNGHTSTEDYLLFDNPTLRSFMRIIDAPRWDTGVIAGGTTHSVKFCDTGTFAYHCEIHNVMRASITVV